MPPTNKWNRGRKPKEQRSIRRILILCEDTKSSRDYLAQFPHDKNQVKIEFIGTGMNTDSLMENAIKRAEQARTDRQPYEKVWVVFDKDDFNWQQFNRAFDLARTQKEMVACWSNECFELWYLLHFLYRDTAMSRADIFQQLSQRLGKEYQKGDANVFALLQDKIEVALRNARKLAFENEEAGEATRNPSTHVHELITALRDLDPTKQQADP